METVRLAAALAAIVVIGAAAVLIARRVLGDGIQRAPEAGAGTSGGSFHDLVTRSLESDPAPLSIYRGKVALVVNVASKCGLTPQYEQLEALHQRLAPRGFTVLGFPSNDFGAQEPGTAGEIRAFCSATYGVTFPMFAKRKVQGADKDEVYRVLTKDLDEPDWNFTKYLVGRDGRVIARFGPKILPEDPRLLEAIDAALEARG